jgi:S-adenosylmethionine decarboxylase
MHLIIDGYDCHSELLSNRISLLRWLDDLPPQIGMSILMPATVGSIHPPKCRPVDEGLSGVVVIHESHIAVHTWPRRGELQADVYSCKRFDAEKVLDHFVHDFGIGSYDTQLIDRRRRTEDGFPPSDIRKEGTKTC